MTHEAVPKNGVVETVAHEQRSKKRKATPYIVAGLAVASVAALGYGGVKYLSRDTVPCQETWDIQPSKVSSTSGEVTLPSGKRMSISVSSYLDRQAVGRNKDIPMVAVSLGGAANYGKQTFAIADHPGPDATFSLESGYEFYVKATEDEVTSWCSKNVIATKPQR